MLILSHSFVNSLASIKMNHKLYRNKAVLWSLNRQLKLPYLRIRKLAHTITQRFEAHHWEAKILSQ